MTMTAAGLPPGIPLALESTLRLTGSAEARVAGGPVGGFRVGRAETALYVVPTDFVVVAPHPGGRFAYAVDSLDHMEWASLQPPEEIPIALLSVNGEPYTFGLELHVTGQAVSSSGIATAGSVGASFDGDFSRTLTWGGITRVTIAETGEEVSGWTVTSDSGFDYSQPFPAPEPSGSLLSATAAAGLALRARGGRSREPGRPPVTG